MGFDIQKFVCKVSEDRVCSLCHQVLDNPVKTPCAHIFCSGCILPWVLRCGACPFSCRALGTCDLDNALPLRELVLNMKVVCDFKDSGCEEQIRLNDLSKHTKECTLRPVECRNKGCGVRKPYKFLAQHEVHDCDFRPVEICKNGCDFVLLHNNVVKHNCVDSLKEQIVKHEGHISHLEGELKKQTAQLQQREKELTLKVTFLQKKLQVQTTRYMNELRNYESQMGAKNNNNCDSQCGKDQRLALVLERSSGTLGFNIMGGYVGENNNNNNNNNNNKEGMVTEGIIVSKVMAGGPAQRRGLKGHDQIVKVNGRDLSQASHEEAVEAFRTAEEPIVVEVLRRVNKNKMKTRPVLPVSTMVSIGTQTEEDIYGYNRPPTPPPAFYPIPYSGLLEPASRRPLVFSQGSEMGLTDIEMAQFDYDDPYYDDRQYEVEYEEVVLQRLSDEEKLGLTLCYGATEEGITDIFVGEIDPYSVAAKDGRIREGDQIVQINGVDIHSRDQAIKLFSEKCADITLLLARPQLQFDDGFMEEHNVVLDELQMEYLEKHHQDNMQIMASMLARGHHFDEEGGTTDTGTTENSSHKHEKDSGVGRTDESTKNDESSEQDVFDNESMMGTRKSGSSKGDAGDQNYSNESFVSNGDGSYGVPDIDCDKFREVLEHRCDKNNLNRISSPRKDLRKVSESTEGSIDRELAQVNREMEGIQMECQEMVNNHLQNKGQKDASSRVSTPLSETYKTPRSVPRMGTRLDFVKTGVSPSPDSSDSVGRRDTPPTPKMGQVRYGKSNDGGNASTSAYNTGESCRSTPLTLELNIASDEGEKGFKNSMLCLATTGTSTTPPVLSQSDTEKQTQTPARSQECSSDENYMTIGSIANKNIHKVDSNNKNNKKLENLDRKLKSGESLQDLYMQYADVMYTNRANLEHTMQIQQKLFQQQMEQKGTHRRHKSSSPSSRHNSISSRKHQNGVSGKQSDVSGNQSGVGGNQSGSSGTQSCVGGNQSPNDSPQHGPNNTGQTPPESGDQMEWVVKRRPDGTRYITRRPLKSKMLKERAKKISEERCGMTTDDDAMSELKTGRFWTKEERKRHLEKYRDQKKKRELMVKAKMETLKETDEKKDGIVELSHRKMNKSKGKKVFDDFVTVQEMLAHGSKTAEGKTYNPLLSVTTV